MACLGVQFMYLNQLSLNVTLASISKEHDYAEWSRRQNYLLSSFLYGYLLTQISGGVLAPKLGPTKMIATSIAASSVLSLLTPLAAYGGVGWLVAIRLLQGMFQGVVFPCLHELWTGWAPRNERTNLVLTALDGIQMGTVNALCLGDLLVDYVSWESVFYIFGVFGCIWCFFWGRTIKDRPEEDQSISQAEKEFILHSMDDVEGQSKHPWRAILTSPAVFACAVANFCQIWGSNTILATLPSFLKENFNYEVAPSAFISTLPYLATTIALKIAGPQADRLQNKGPCTTTQVRRNFTCASFIAQVIFMLAGALVLNAIQTSILMSLAVAMRALGWAGYIVNLLDLSPRSAGVMMGLVGSVGTIADITSPFITGLLTPNSTIDEWNVLFLITAGIYLIGSFVYWLLASGELQPWAIEKREQDRRQTQDSEISSVNDYSTYL
ncbi:Sialin, Sodium/sialic acid cotransporter [Culex quinquefasciatus]|uniref:Sialin, Sodium/sialic acid cotransporter n=1 Tax=Culex quinquefasciatus TaxID=7176 RepID=B0WK24_CULQU|nr:Sialin, Sodium/sialic acid cotransporter [Culex quinquefasciatus]|eukprot:XP_001849058.1 Sialin, Sodium/sialic acid cotransporter [Culex quinquefasciatus]